MSKEYVPSLEIRKGHLGDRLLKQLGSLLNKNLELDLVI